MTPRTFVLAIAVNVCDVDWSHRYGDHNQASAAVIPRDLEYEFFTTAIVQLNLDDFSLFHFEAPFEMSGLACLPACLYIISRFQGFAYRANDLCLK